MKHKLEVDGIRLEFDQRRILSDIYFKCQTGCITGLLGRNGQGKTCLMNIVYGSLEAASKSVRFDDVTVYEAFKRSDLITYLPQFHFIPASLTLKRVFLDFDISYHDFLNYFPELKNQKNKKINELSGGQIRLIEVYVIIKSRSQFSMLDEPFSHIMPLHIEQIKKLLADEKTNKGFLITDHLFRQITEISDYLYVLKDGKMHLTKSVEDIKRLGYARI